MLVCTQVISCHPACLHINPIVYTDRAEADHLISSFNFRLQIHSPSQHPNPPTPTHKCLWEIVIKDSQLHKSWLNPAACTWKSYWPHSKAGGHSCSTQSSRVYTRPGAPGLYWVGVQLLTWHKHAFLPLQPMASRALESYSTSCVDRQKHSNSNYAWFKLISNKQK